MPTSPISQGSDGSELFDDDEYDAAQIFALIKSHESFDTLIFDERLFDSGILTEGGYDWLKDVWAVIEKSRATGSGAEKEEKRTIEV